MNWIRSYESVPEFDFETEVAIVAAHTARAAISSLLEFKIPFAQRQHARLLGGVDFARCPSLAHR